MKKFIVFFAAAAAILSSCCNNNCSTIKYGEQVVGGQALGQKNNVFIIWLGYTFLSPITALSGGFFAIWQNIVNSYLLYRKEHNEQR